MFTFGFFAKVFFSGALSACVLSFCSERFFFGETLATKIAYWFTTTLFYIACSCVVGSVFGMIWTI